MQHQVITKQTTLNIISVYANGAFTAENNALIMLFIFIYKSIVC